MILFNQIFVKHSVKLYLSINQPVIVHNYQLLESYCYLYHFLQT